MDRKVEEGPEAGAKPPEIAKTPSPKRRRAVAGVAIATWKSLFADNVSLLAAGVAFYSLLAIFPGLAFMVAVFGLLADPAQVQLQLLKVRDVLPEEAWNAISAQLNILASQSTATLSIASLVSLALALINARLAAYAMMGALNAVHKLEETRSFLRINIIAFTFTIAAIAILTMNILAVIAAPFVLDALGLSKATDVIIRILRWPVLTLLMTLGLALIYRFGPDRRGVRWHWLTLGSVVATALWLLGSFAFSWYVTAFNSFDRLYGSFGAIVVLLYWFWVTAFAALVGAELDMQIHAAVSGEE